MFQNLFKLYYSHNRAKRIPLEDFNTEVYAGLLRLSPGFLGAIIDFLQLPEDSYEVKTQDPYSLEEGKCLIDMVLVGERNVCFIENKINSSEGEEQLNRYCDVMEQNFPEKEKHLIYCTKYTDPKDVKRYNFRQIRWYEIAKILLEHPENPYLKNYYEFLKQHNMNTKDVFSPEMIIGMKNINDIIGTVRLHIENAKPSFQNKFLGNPSFHDAITNIEKNRMGYCFKDILPGGRESELMYAIRLGKVRLETHIFIPNSHPQLDEVKKSMETFDQSKLEVKLESKRRSPGFVIYCYRDLYDLINDAGADKVIKDWFEGSFDSFAQFIRDTPQLEWNLISRKKDKCEALDTKQ